MLTRNFLRPVSKFHRLKRFVFRVTADTPFPLKDYFKVLLISESIPNIFHSMAYDGQKKTSEVTQDFIVFFYYVQEKQMHLA
jgi:hypothetical protein